MIESGERLFGQHILDILYLEAGSAGGFDPVSGVLRVPQLPRDEQLRSGYTSLLKIQSVNGS